MIQQCLNTQINPIDKIKRTKESAGFKLSLFLTTHNDPHKDVYLGKS